MTSPTPALISIIVPLYNQEAFVADCLASLERQSLREIEVLIVNDGSTDLGPEIARSICRRDARFRMIEQPNKGLSAARNTGIQQANGRHIAFLDSDDVWHADCALDAVEVLSSKTAESAVVFHARLIDQSGKFIHSDRRDDLEISREVSRWRLFSKNQAEAFWAGNPFPPCAVILRREAICQLGYFDSSLSSLEDYDMWLRFLQQGGTFHYVPKPRTYYRRSPESMSRNISRMADNWEHILQTSASHLAKSDLAVFAHTAKSLWVSNQYLGAGELVRATHSFNALDRPAIRRLNAFQKTLLLEAAIFAPIDSEILTDLAAPPAAHILQLFYSLQLRLRRKVPLFPIPCGFREALIHPLVTWRLFQHVISQRGIFAAL